MSDFDRQKWNAKYVEDAASDPSAVLTSLAEYLPEAGQVLDIAGGAGRNAIWLAQRGLDVTVADISEVGLSVARQRAAEAGVSLQTLTIDFDVEDLPAGPWDLVLSVCFLCRKTIAKVPGILKVGGRLVMIQPTLRNLERHSKPPADFLLRENELPTLVGPLEIVCYREDWHEDGRHDAVVVAQRRRVKGSGVNCRNGPSGASHN